MIAAWMVVSVLVGIVVAIGALALDAGARASQSAVRWTWMGALTLVVVLTMLVPLRRTRRGSVLRVHVNVMTAVADKAAGRGAAPVLPRTLAAARAMLDASVARAARSVEHVVSPTMERWLLGAWIACSLALFALGLVVLRRLLQARRAWPVASLHGERVHVAPDAGPAVLGLVRGTIVVPCWLDECDPQVQRAVLAHEREHVRARDPLLLALGAMSAVLLPWNPVVWWMLARLRLAVELDCDRRVIGAGVRTRDYGTLLIDLAGRTAGVPLGVPLIGLTMLAERTTHLERRIVAMSAPRSRHAALRIAAGSLVALTAVLAACEARMPTSVDVDNMTAASAARAATAVGLMSAKDTLTVGTYYVDGRVVSAQEARAIAPEKIATVLVMRDAADQSRGTVHITTRDAALRAEHVGGTFTITAPRMEAGAAAHDSMHFAGLVFIDGKRTDPGAMKSLSPADIVGINVIKGARAAELYPNEPAAAQGVIQITTKHAH